MQTPAIEATGLTKRYRRNAPLAVDHIDLTVAQGEVMGFLGPNGSGKTTTIRLMLDLIRPSEGSVALLGTETRAGGPALRRRIGYLPGELPFGGRQTGRELLTFLGNLRGGVRPERVDSLAERFVLDLRKPIRTLSKGNKQKVGIVQAFMHDPELLVLDEPSSGLDPLLQREFLQLVRERRDAGTTVFMSSHILSEVESVADRIAVLKEGRLISVEDVEEARARAPRRVAIVFAEEVPEEVFAALPGVSELRIDGRVLRCRLVGDADALVKAAAQYHVISVVAEPPNLEDSFLGMYQRGGASDVA